MAEKEEITDREKAIFEAGIKLGAVYHQFTTTPVSPETAEELETAIERSISIQPYVSFVKVNIDMEKVRECANANEFNYCELNGEMLDITVAVRYRTAEVHARVKYDEERDYPLMRIEKGGGNITNITNITKDKDERINTTFLKEKIKG
ncbi:MAG: dihydroneopterin aldolase family protein [Methanophagales archaeon]|nr:dihydroneopterin aldolase family protein [Methanophagales archaeon]